MSINLDQYYPKRAIDVRKGDYGRVIIAGGSNRYSGCLAFNGLAALRAGADLAIIVAPTRPANIVAGYSPDLITIPSRTSYPNPTQVSEALEPADSLIVGCGVERTTAAHNALTRIIRDCLKPMVVDAESLHAIKSKPDVLRGKRAVLTPNGGEYKTLTGRDWPKDVEDREEAAKLLARHYGCTVIVKGNLDYISDGEQVAIDRASSSYMTKGGHGDLLAGVIGAHLARGRDVFDATRIGAYIVGRAGEEAAKKYGESLLASDVLDYIPGIINRHSD